MGDAGSWYILLASGFSLLLFTDIQAALASQPVSVQPWGHCPTWHELSAPCGESREGAAQLHSTAGCRQGTPEDAALRDKELSPGLSQHQWGAGAGTGVMDLQHMLGNQELPIPPPAQGCRIVPLLDVQRLDLVTKFCGENVLFCSSQGLIQPKGCKCCSISKTPKPAFAGQDG